MSALPFSTYGLGEKLTRSACERLDVQLFFGQDPDEFVAVQQSHAVSGYRQLPFMAATRNAANGPFFWTMVRRGNRILGQSGALIVPGRGARGGALADELACGLLYSQKSTWLERRGWLAGAGPKLTARGNSLYCGGAWLHPDLRGLNLIGVLSRLTSLQALEHDSGIQSVWVMEEDKLLQKGALARPSGLGFGTSEKVFSGHLEIAGKPLTMHAIWAWRDEYLSLLVKDDLSYRSGREPDWFVGAAVSTGRDRPGSRGRER